MAFHHHCKVKLSILFALRHKEPPHGTDADKKGHARSHSGNGNKGGDERTEDTSHSIEGFHVAYGLTAVVHALHRVFYK